MALAVKGVKVMAVSLDSNFFYIMVTLQTLHKCIYISQQHYLEKKMDSGRI